MVVSRLRRPAIALTRYETLVATVISDFAVVSSCFATRFIFGEKIRFGRGLYSADLVSFLTATLGSGWIFGTGSGSDLGWGSGSDFGSGSGSDFGSGSGSLFGSGSGSDFGSGSGSLFGSGSGSDFGSGSGSDFGSGSGSDFGSGSGSDFGSGSGSDFGSELDSVGPVSRICGKFLHSAVSLLGLQPKPTHDVPLTFRITSISRCSFNILQKTL